MRLRALSPFSFPLPSLLPLAPTRARVPLSAGRRGGSHDRGRSRGVGHRTARVSGASSGHGRHTAAGRRSGGRRGDHLAGGGLCTSADEKEERQVRGANIPW